MAPKRKRREIVPSPSTRRRKDPPTATKIAEDADTKETENAVIKKAQNAATKKTKTAATKKAQNVATNKTESAAATKANEEEEEKPVETRMACKRKRREIDPSLSTVCGKDPSAATEIAENADTKKTKNAATKKTKNAATKKAQSAAAKKIENAATKKTENAAIEKTENESTAKDVTVTENAATKKTKLAATKKAQNAATQKTEIAAAKKTDNAATQNAKKAAPVKHSTVRRTQSNDVNIRIKQAKDLAVAQAQQDGCTGNYKIFDSPFGNFLLPVVPSRAELASQFSVAN